MQLFLVFLLEKRKLQTHNTAFFLETVWSALENAGYNCETYRDRIGLFAGVAASDYLLSNLYNNHTFIESADSYQVLIGNDKDFLPTLVSYKLNLRGPSINVQTACSTSLVAVHLACQSLLNGESDIALAGGVTIAAKPKTGYEYQPGGIKSPDGHCRAFDINANGTVFGNGVGVVVLKRLEDAINDGDFIHAIIKGSAVNNDGSLKVGYTAPSVDGQREVILEALALAGVEAETVSYIETHGTGTALGDPIEIQALTQAFRHSTYKTGFCAIGSVKTNIGHLDTAAGVTGLIKTVLALKHQQIPASLHFQQPNPQIDFANSPFYVNTKLSEWTTNSTPRRAGVSSFGIGGTNAHVILEEAPVIPASSSSRPWQLLLLSAKTSTALATATAQLRDYLTQNSDVPLADVAYTLQVGRRAFDYRRVMICHDQADAVKLLDNQDPQRVFNHYYQPSHCPVIFMFSGQGSQYANMGRELYELEPTYKKHVDACAEILQPYLGLDIRSLLYPHPEATEATANQLQQTFLTQSALFVTEYALAQLLMSWGVHPEAMIGHSIGEYVAAAIAGVFSLEDALAIVAKRGQLMQQLPAGSMLAIKLPAKDVQSLLDTSDLYRASLQIAVINSPSACVVSGISSAITALEEQLTVQAVECRRLHTSHAFHSLMMEPILPAFRETFKTVKLHPPKISFISNVTGTWITPAQATNPDYWCQHLRQTVRFSEGILQLIQQFDGVFLEVGPGRSLSTLTTQHLNKNSQQQVLSLLRHIKDEQSDICFLLQTLGRLWLAGIEIDWSGFYSDEQRHRLPLPTYPFEGKRYWIDPQASSVAKQDIADWFYIPSWKRSLLTNSSAAVGKSIWLLFVDDLGVGEQILDKLKNQGNTVVTVHQGDEFQKISTTSYQINPYSNSDYELLIQELLSSGIQPENIAYFWSLSQIENSQPDKYLECKSLLSLIQSISKLKHHLQIKVITNNILEVNGNEKLNPEKSTILGLCQVISQEYPNITCQCIDIVFNGDRSNNQIIDQISNELISTSLDNVIAYRDRHRWVQTFTPSHLDAIVDENTPFRNRGTYLFAGGLDNLEFLLAEYLTKTCQAKLIFIESSQFPKQENFSQWLETHQPDDAISQKIQHFIALEEIGAAVLLLRADKTNYEQMHQILAKNVEQINGVIYATGIKHEQIFGSLPEITVAELENILKSQRHQITILEKVLQNYDLDFCCIFSSLTSILGGFGLCLDAAVYQLLDSFGNQHNQNNSCPWYIINWDNIQLHTTPESTITEQVSGTTLAITATAIIEVFQRVLAIQQGTQMIISPVDINVKKTQIINRNSSLETQSKNQLDSSPRYSRPSLNNSYIAPTNELEKQITEIWQEVLGIKEIGIYDNFYELGGDSLIATQLVSRLRAKFPVELPLRDLLVEAMIPMKQAEIIEQLMLEKIADLSEEEVAVLLSNV
ncbi:PscL [Nostoc piscinale CENA21]|uniref:PscL n=1 Tax=Nostoc piscinale CENA21 TaxID=224013 RepID=A0A0M4T2E0_9NOSO|nr:PscL [Nostoc piscinale CENA21]